MTSALRLPPAALILIVLLQGARTQSPTATPTATPTASPTASPTLPALAIVVDSCPGGSGVVGGSQCVVASAQHAVRCCEAAPNVCFDSICNPTFITDGKQATLAEAELCCVVVIIGLVIIRRRQQRRRAQSEAPPKAPAPFVVAQMQPPAKPRNSGASRAPSRLAGQPVHLPAPHSLPPPSAAVTAARNSAGADEGKDDTGPDVSEARSPSRSPLHPAMHDPSRPSRTFYV